MKKLKINLIFFLAIFLFFSCNEEKELSPNMIEDTKLLDSLIFKGFYDNEPLLTIAKFNYNDENKVNNIQFSVFDIELNLSVEYLDEKIMKLTAEVNDEDFTFNFIIENGVIETFITGESPNEINSFTSLKYNGRLLQSQVWCTNDNLAKCDSTYYWIYEYEDMILSKAIYRNFNFPEGSEDFLEFDYSDKKNPLSNVNSAIALLIWRFMTVDINNQFYLFNPSFFLPERIYERDLFGNESIFELNHEVDNDNFPINTIFFSKNERGAEINYVYKK